MDIYDGGCRVTDPQTYARPAGTPAEHWRAGTGYPARTASTPLAPVDTTEVVPGNERRPSLGCTGTTLAAPVDKPNPNWCSAGLFTLAPSG